jgi:uncharacterized protein
MPAEPTIDYETLAQDAMRGVVRTVLTQAAKQGLPGDHHFYISFDTSASGVILSKRLKDKYPNEMTIVLQHRFWDLSVQDDGFEVKLTFDGIPERLVVTYAAIRVFFDPSVRYGLQFEDLEAEPEAGEDMSQRFGGRRPGSANGTRATTLRSTAPKKPKVSRKTKSDKGGIPTQDTQPVPAPATAKLTPAAPKVDDDKPRQDNGGAQIVRLDAFRKK